MRWEVWDYMEREDSRYSVNITRINRRFSCRQCLISLSPYLTISNFHTSIHPSYLSHHIPLTRPQQLQTKIGHMPQPRSKFRCIPKTHREIKPSDRNLLRIRTKRHTHHLSASATFPRFLVLISPVSVVTLSLVRI